MPDADLTRIAAEVEAEQRRQEEGVQSTGFSTVLQYGAVFSSACEPSQRSMQVGGGVYDFSSIVFDTGCDLTLAQTGLEKPVGIAARRLYGAELSCRSLQTK